MEENKIIEKLVSKTNISYEKAESTLRECNWNILDSILKLEEEGEINKPEVSIYYTNKNYTVSKNELIKIKAEENKKYRSSQGFFEFICNLIDRGNKIIFQVSRYKKVIIKLPSTVMILLLMFTFWVTVPVLIVGLFFDFEYSFVGYLKEDNILNNFLKKISKEISIRKRNKRRGKKYD